MIHPLSTTQFVVISGGLILFAAVALFAFLSHDDSDNF